MFSLLVTAVGGVIVLLVLLAVIGVVAWLLTAYLPMPDPLKKIIIVVACLLALLLVLDAFGILGGGDGHVIWVH